MRFVSIHSMEFNQFRLNSQIKRFTSLAAIDRDLAKYQLIFYVSLLSSAARNGQSSENRLMWSLEASEPCWKFRLEFISIRFVCFTRFRFAFSGFPVKEDSHVTVERCHQTIQLSAQINGRSASSPACRCNVLAIQRNCDHFRK